MKSPPIAGIPFFATGVELFPVGHSGGSGGQQGAFPSFARKPLELVSSGGTECVQPASGFGSKCALSREQQLSVLIAEL